MFQVCPDKEFSGTDRTGAGRSGPVQFEREEDPFGLDQFLSQAKRASKRKEPERRDDRDKKRKGISKQVQLLQNIKKLCICKNINISEENQ